LALQNHRVRQLVAGCYHCAAVTEDGALFTWESSSAHETDQPQAELGYGSFVHDFRAPHRVFAFDGVRIISVADGNIFTVVVTEAGAVYSFGMADRRLGHGEVDGEEGVFSWGTNGRDSPVYGRGKDSDSGGVGDDSDDVDYFISQVITALLGQRVRAIAAGPYTSCAVTDAGALYTWGENCCGSLGHGDVRDRDRPTLVTALQGIRVVGAALYEGRSLALAADGSVYLFGEGSGHGDERATPSPQSIPDLVCMVPGR
jgi:alpha-tubulin suppressor-like RCC1 family protein